MDSEGEGEGGMIWENGIETCILSCKKQIASLCLMQNTGCLGLVHGDDPERCYGEGGGRRGHVWNACTPVVDSCQCMAKPIQYCKVKYSKNKNLKKKLREKNKIKWTGIGEFNSDDHYIYYCWQEALRRNRVAIIVNKRV